MAYIGRTFALSTRQSYPPTPESAFLLHSASFHLSAAAEAEAEESPWTLCSFRQTFTGVKETVKYARPGDDASPFPKNLSSKLCDRLERALV